MITITPAQSKNRPNHVTTLLLLIALVSLTTTAKTHTFLLNPMPYKFTYSPVDCKGSECRACPEIKEPYSKMRNTPKEPARTYKRGEEVTIKWSKNNHNGGFIRFAFVPLNLMFDTAAQTRRAFYTGCWNQGAIACDELECGTDDKGKILSRKITIPAVIPDGIYVFSSMWYGGVHFLREMGLFADYYSCSYVRVEGGEPLIESFQPFYDQGENAQFEEAENGACRTANDRPGLCTGRFQCGGFKAIDDLPHAFKNGNLPEPLTPSLFSDNVGPIPTDAPSTSPSMSATPSMSAPVFVAIPSASMSPFVATPSVSVPPFVEPPVTSSEEPTASVSPSVSAVAIPGSEEEENQLCNEMVCCPSTCGKCGGAGCQRRPGGADNCCSRSILANGIYCDTSGVPCIRPKGEEAPETFLKPSPSASASASTSGSEDGNDDDGTEEYDTGACNAKVCCKSSCLQCGGRGCSRRDGGSENCCTRKIKKSGRYCETDLPPCIQS